MRPRGQGSSRNVHTGFAYREYCVDSVPNARRDLVDRLPDGARCVIAPLRENGSPRLCRKLSSCHCRIRLCGPVAALQDRPTFIEHLGTLVQLSLQTNADSQVQIETESKVLL